MFCIISLTVIYIQPRLRLTISNINVLCFWGNITRFAFELIDSEIEIELELGGEELGLYGAKEGSDGCLFAFCETSELYIQNVFSAFFRRFYHATA